MRTLIDAAASTPYALPILIAATSGMRRSEIVRIQWGNVDLDSATASIVDSKDGHRTQDDPPARLDGSVATPGPEGTGRAKAPVRRSAAGRRPGGRPGGWRSSEPGLAFSCVRRDRRERRTRGRPVPRPPPRLQRGAPAVRREPKACLRRAGSQPRSTSTRAPCRH
jgi:integrase